MQHNTKASRLLALAAATGGLTFSLTSDVLAQAPEDHSQHKDTAPNAAKAPASTPATQGGKSGATHIMPDGTKMPGAAHGGQQGAMQHGAMKAPTLAELNTPKALPPAPANVPEWMFNKDTNHVFYKRGPYNFDVYKVPKLAYDLNAVAVGHSMAYEDLVTGRAATLESATFNRINNVLNNPPKLMPDERFISPTFGRKYGVLEQMFDWTHILHAQTIDVLASPDLTEVQKEVEISAVYSYYAESVPFTITPLPMNMGWLDSQPYSKAFRVKYPKVNGLFWGYHWLQTGMHDLGYGKTTAQINADYETMGRQYHEVELYRTDRPFMPMFAETSPQFATKFPQIANVSDNLHMLHDVVNDILATDWMSESQKDEQILRAMWIVSADAHRNCKPGDYDPNNPLHDHRFMPGMPGMGMMPEGMGHGAMNHGSGNQNAAHTMPDGTKMPGAAHGGAASTSKSGTATGGAKTNKPAAQKQGGEHAGH